jgi:hypothetical protein
LTRGGFLMEAFTVESKLVRKATGYEKEPTPHRHRVRRLREPSFRPPLAGTRLPTDFSDEAFLIIPAPGQ